MTQEWESNYRRPRRRRFHRTKIRTGTGAKLLIMLAVVAAVIFGIAIFFRVNTVVVRGNSVYDTQSIIEASGVSVGDSLLAVNRSAVAARIDVSLPYVEKVRVALVLPDTVVVEITESSVLLSVLSDTGEFWLMNTRGKMVEQVTAEKAEQYPSLEGVTVKEPQSGEKAVASAEENLQAALSLLSALDGSGLTDKISRLDVVKAYDLTLWYTDQYEIRFGAPQDLDHKVRYLLAVMGELMEYQSGTIDVTFEKEILARFLPW